MSLDIRELIAEREIERYQLHTSHLNEQMVHVLKTIGFDKRYQRGVGQYLLVSRLTALPFELVHAERYLVGATKRPLGMSAQFRQRIEIVAAGSAHGCVPPTSQRKLLMR